jgi:hypothetical protein
LDADLLGVLAPTLQSLDEDLEELVRKLLEQPINLVLQYAAANLNDPSGLKLEEYLQMAQVCLDFGKHDDAKTLFSMVRDKVEEKWGSLHPLVIQCLIGIAGAERAKGLNDDAELTYRQILANGKRRSKPNKVVYAALKQLAEFLEEIGKQDEADKVSAEADALEPELERVEQTKWLQKTYKERKEVEQIEAAHSDDPKLIPLFESLAEAYSNQEKWAESKVFYERLLAAYEKSAKSEPYDRASALVGLAKVLERLNQDKEAEDCYLQGIALLEPLVTTKALGSWRMPYILEDYAKLLQRTGREAKAAELLERAKVLRKPK